jgi:hypothetical protein
VQEFIEHYQRRIHTGAHHSYDNPFRLLLVGSVVDRLRGNI